MPYDAKLNWFAVSSTFLHALKKQTKNFFFAVLLKPNQC